MKPVSEIEYLPLKDRKEEPRKKRGFLTRLLDCLSREKVIRYGSSSNPSSGEEVEEDVIEF